MALRRDWRPRRAGFDAWFFTIAHWAGLAILFYAFAIDRLRNPAIPTIGFGLAVMGNTNNRNGGA